MADLVKRRVTTPAHLGCIGGSNGGLLVGNMLVMRPDLFGAVVCQAPLLDMKRYHKLLAGASWMGEYGNPDDPKEWAFIRGWSPYQLARKDLKYPPSLFTAAIRDDRVHPGHARKMVAKLEAQGHDVRYYENIEGGHSGSANNREQAYISALAYPSCGAPWDRRPRPQAGPVAATRSSRVRRPREPSRRRRRSNAWANSGMFDTGPMQRNRPGECGSVLMRSERLGPDVCCAQI